MRNRIVLLAVVIGLLVGAAGVGLIVVTDDDGATSVSANLPKLPIGVLGELNTSARGAADMMLAMPVEWRVKGDLPDLPAHATAYRIGSPTDDAQRRLVAAIGAPGLTAGPRGEWSFPNCAPPTVDTPSDVAESGSVSCAVASSGVAVACPSNTDCPKPPIPPPPSDLPTRDEARGIALRALQAAGIDTTGHVEVYGPGDAWEVTVEPQVGGRRVFGAANNLSIGPKGAIIRGGGQLLTTDEVGEYPLVSTARGFERLKAQSYPGVLRGRPEPAIAFDQSAPVPDSGPVVRTITGVTLGLQPSFGATEAYLVPIFLFETDDGGVVPVPAVIDALLEQPGAEPGPVPVPKPDGPPQQVPPSPPSDGGGSGGGGSGSSQSCAGSASGSSAGGDPNQPLALEVCASPTNPKPGETVTFSLKASDPDAAVDAEGCQQPHAAYGDEEDQSVSCMSLCQKDNPSPESMTLSRTFTHAFAKPGTYTATFTAASCAPKQSYGKVALEITVRG